MKWTYYLRVQFYYVNVDLRVVNFLCNYYDIYLYIMLGLYLFIFLLIYFCCFVFLVLLLKYLTIVVTGHELAVTGCKNVLSNREPDVTKEEKISVKNVALPEGKLH